MSYRVPVRRPRVRVVVIRKPRRAYPFVPEWLKRIRMRPELDALRPQALLNTLASIAVRAERRAVRLASLCAYPPEEGRRLALMTNLGGDRPQRVEVPHV